jgi:hypothetical protein
MPDSSAATQSLIYNTDGTLKDGKELWCASCHDQSEAGTAVIDGFEGPLDGWGSAGDVNDEKSGIVPFWGSESSAGMERGIKGQYLNVWLEWSRSTDCNGTVWKNMDPAVDFSNRDSFNFYLKFSDFAAYVSVDGILGVKVGLREAGTTEYSVCQFYINYDGDPDPYIKINEFVDRVWKLVSLPREAFTDPDWGMVDQIYFQFYEKACTGNYTVVVHLDEIGCDITGANVVGDNQTWGCFTTGHGYCAWCHDSTREHIDYNRLTIWEYILADSRIEGEYDEHDNPTNFRFYDDPEMQVRLALRDYDNDELPNDYALCYQCHPEDWLRGDIQEQMAQGEPYTNFRDDDYNIHDTHLPGPTRRITCVACHDPHGQSSMAMMRDEMGGLIYLDAEEYPCKIEYGADTDGDGKMDWHDPDINKGAAQTRSGGGSTIEETPYLGVFCITCHSWPLQPDENDCYDYPYGCCGKNGCEGSCTSAYYMRDYAYVPHSDKMNCFSVGCHTVGPMHAAHFFSVTGPGFEQNENGCNECHADGRVQCADGPLFKNPLDPDLPHYFSETNACFACHSASGL